VAIQNLVNSTRNTFLYGVVFGYADAWASCMCATGPFLGFKAFTGVEQGASKLILIEGSQSYPCGVGSSGKHVVQCISEFIAVRLVATCALTRFQSWSTM